MGFVITICISLIIVSLIVELKDIIKAYRMYKADMLEQEMKMQKMYYEARLQEERMKKHE